MENEIKNLKRSMLISRCITLVIVIGFVLSNLTMGNIIVKMDNTNLELNKKIEMLDARIIDLEKKNYRVQ